MFFSSIRFDWYATWVKPWPWPEVKFWPWPFKVMLYMFRCVLTRQTRWRQNYCYIISNTEVIIEKLSLKNAVFDLSWPLTLKQLILGEICRLKSCSSYDVIISWPDLTRPIFFHQKLRKGCPISNGKFQHHSPNGEASSSEKLMGGGGGLH